MTTHRSTATEVEDESAGSIADRLRELLGNQTFAQISRATGCNSETVRRYMHGGTPSVTFLIAVARHYGASPTWLLLGEGPKGLGGGRGGPLGTAEGVGGAAGRNGHTASGGAASVPREPGSATNGVAFGVVVCAPGAGGAVQDRSRG